MKPDDGYIAYIINPKSGASTGEKLPGWRFEEYLTGRGFEVRMNLTRSLEHACELATSAAGDDNCAMVVAVGGDGTIREVAHGLESSDKPLLIVPGGTENLLANELGLEKSLKTLTRTFEAGFTRDLDLGNANGKCFTSIAGFGFDGEVVAEVSGNRIGHINYFDYFWPIVADILAIQLRFDVCRGRWRTEFLTGGGLFLSAISPDMPWVLTFSNTPTTATGFSTCAFTSAPTGCI